MTGITTHVLDITTGRPLSGLQVELYDVATDPPTLLNKTRTNPDGRTDTPILPAASARTGQFELRFHDLTSRIVEDWGNGSDNFAKDPPNATVSAFQKDGSGVRDAVVVLKNPKLEGENLVFDVDILEGDIKGADGAASVFIDIIGRPFTPLSFAGVARRTAFRGAYYAGAAAVGAAAVGAAAAYGPYYRPPACGYYPYPPCY